MLLAAEVMFFTGLIGAYVVLRGSVAGPWPPPDQPRLPLAVTSVNSAILFLSAWTMRRAVVALERTLPRSLRWALVETALLGATFLVIQGSEWARLVWHGLTASSSIYGATFYTLIGTHGLHVAAAVVWLTVVALRFHGDRFSLKRTSGVEALSLYWYFVCALWAVLFPLVYLW
jgi:heme/copper-type cytochrome/quinol oxidase subunit 3